LRPIEALTAEPFHELLRVGGFFEAVDVKPLAIVIERMTTRTQRQVSAELVYLVVAAALVHSRWQHDLMRPITINCSRRQFAFAPHVQTAE
jgi:hypothetical protein